jgi:hypothetical protein
MSELDRKIIQQPNNGRPHVVILGAGASLAAFPNGDKNGRKLPLMWNIVDVIGLGTLLDESGIKEYRDNFEKLYSELVTTGKYPELVAKIDQAIFDYFANMQLPNEPTLYDHLVLSLRNKDVIATFNWDPFLVQAMARNGNSNSLPLALFLHGNTAIGYCMGHKPLHVGPRGHHCRRCGKPLQDSRLLYPVSQKNYNRDPFIAKSWELLQKFLEDAFLVTVFGYSAPVTDVEAIELLKSAWGDPHLRALEEIEFIDIKEEEILYQTWKLFIHSHHYQTTKSFYDSIIGRSPRRSCEAMWMCLMDAVFIDENPIPQSANWTDLRLFYDVLLDDERAIEQSE